MRLLLVLVLALASPAAAQPAADPAAARAHALQENELISRYNAAATAKDWPAAVSALKALIAFQPRWTYALSLGESEQKLGEFDAALAAYDQAETLAAGLDAPQRAAALSQINNGRGVVFARQRRNKEAVAAFTRAADGAPDQGLAWFNVCAMAYNLGDTDTAKAACDRSIAADPKRANAWFIKGSLLVADSTTDKAGKLVAAPGALEALHRYLELEPNGPHAADVKAMLDVFK